jgi:hypothetical protein
MKTSNSLRLTAIAFVAALTTIFATPALANDEIKVIPVELKFVGNVHNQPLFHLVFSNLEEAQFTITVRDGFGNVYYRETVKGASFLKKFVLNVEELDESKLKFEISSKSYDKPVVFEINNNVQYTENIVVNKVK